MRYRVKLRELPAKPWSVPAPRPVEVPGFTIEADSVDAAKEEARRRLLNVYKYQSIRSVSVLVDGGLTAVVQGPRDA